MAAKTERHGKRWRRDSFLRRARCVWRRFVRCRRRPRRRRCSPAHERHATRRLPKCRPTGILSARARYVSDAAAASPRAIRMRARSRRLQASGPPLTLVASRIARSTSPPDAATTRHRTRPSTGDARGASGPRRRDPPTAVYSRDNYATPAAAEVETRAHRPRCHCARDNAGLPFFLFYCIRPYNNI